MTSLSETMCICLSWGKHNSIKLELLFNKSWCLISPPVLSLWGSLGNSWPLEFSRKFQNQITHTHTHTHTQWIARMFNETAPCEINHPVWPSKQLILKSFTCIIWSTTSEYNVPYMSVRPWMLTWSDSLSVLSSFIFPFTLSAFEKDVLKSSTWIAFTFETYISFFVWTIFIFSSHSVKYQWSYTWFPITCIDIDMIYLFPCFYFQAFCVFTF